MNQRATVLLQEALQLPEKERGEMAAQLVASLDFLSEDNVEPAWAIEIQKRLEELATGLVKPIPWEDARRMILEDTDDSSKN